MEGGGRKRHVLLHSSDLVAGLSLIAQSKLLRSSGTDQFTYTLFLGKLSPLNI